MYLSCYNLTVLCSTENTVARNRPNGRFTRGSTVSTQLTITNRAYSVMKRAPDTRNQLPYTARGITWLSRPVNFYFLPCNATHGIAKAFLSVCLSARRVDCDRTNETCNHTLIPRNSSDFIVLLLCMGHVAWFKINEWMNEIPHERLFNLVFWQEEWLVGVNGEMVKFWAKLVLLERKRLFSINIRS